MTKIKQLIEGKKTSYGKWLDSKKLEDKIEYKRNTSLAETEMRKRHKIYWDKFVINLEHKTHRT